MTKTTSPSAARTVTIAPQLVLATSMLDKLGGSWSWGPLTLTYSLNLNPLSVSGTVSFFGIQVADFNLNANNPTIAFDATVQGIGLKGSLTLDIPNRNLEGSFTIEYPFGSKSWSGVIFHW